MRVLLRVIAVFAGVSVIATLWFMARLGTHGWSVLLRSGALGVVTLAGWLITLIAGPIATVQLFRLRSSGRVAALVLFGSVFLYYGFGLFLLRTPEAPIFPLVAASILFGSLVIVLLTPAAHRVCVAAEVTDRLIGG